LKKKKLFSFDKVYLDQVALDSNYEKDDENENDKSVDNISVPVNFTLEYKVLREELEKMHAMVYEKNKECQEAYEKMKAMSADYTNLLEKYKALEEKYIKEQKKSHLLEIENGRSLDEIKSLKKQRNELMAKCPNEENATLGDKLKKIIDKLFGK
jgi:hypothetical protein